VRKILAPPPPPLSKQNIMKFIQNKLTNLYLLIKQQKNPYQIVKEKEMVYLHTVVQTLANG
jgi:hypothetical protein